MNKASNPFLKYSWIILQFLLFSMSIGFIVAGVKRGIDLTDEGGFILSITNTQMYRGGIYNYHIIIYQIVPEFLHNLIGLRWVSILFTQLSALVLSFGVFRWLKAMGKSGIASYSKWIVGCFIGLGIMLIYFPGIAVVNNNVLINCILVICSGMILYLYSLPPAQPNTFKWVIPLLLLGFMSAFSFFIKFPVGVMQLGLYSLAMLFHLSTEGFKAALTSVGVILIGLLIGLLTYFIAFQSFGE